MICWVTGCQRTRPGLKSLIQSLHVDHVSRTCQWTVNCQGLWLVLQLWTSLRCLDFVSSGPRMSSCHSQAPHLYLDDASAYQRLWCRPHQGSFIKPNTHLEQGWKGVSHQSRYSRWFDLSAAPHQCTIQIYNAVSGGHSRSVCAQLDTLPDTRRGRAPRFHFHTLAGKKASRVSCFTMSAISPFFVFLSRVDPQRSHDFCSNTQ